MRSNIRFLPLAAVFLGFGILITCFMPPQALVVIVSLFVIAVGIAGLKC
jgi:hypothetical protein